MPPLHTEISWQSCEIREVKQYAPTPFLSTDLRTNFSPRVLDSVPPSVLPPPVFL